MRKQTLRIIYIMIIMLCTLTTIKAQNKTYIPGDKEFANKSINDLIEICNKYNREYDDLHLKAVARKLIIASKDQKNETGEGYANYFLGIADLFSGNRERGLRYLWKAKHCADVVKNDTLASYIFNALGIYENKAGSNYLSRWYYREGLSRARRAQCYEQFGIIMANLSELSIQLRDTSGIRFAEECYQMGVKRNIKFMMYNGATYKAVSDFFQKKYKSAEEWLDKALAINIKENTTTPITLAYKAELLARRKQFDEAIKYADKALASAKRVSVSRIPLAFRSIAETYFYQGEYTKALTALDSAYAYAKNNAIYTTKEDINLVYAKVYAGMKNYQKAYEYEKLAHDEFMNTEYQRRTHILEECRIMMIMLQKDQQEMAQRAIKEQHNHIVIAEIAVAVMFVFLCIISFITFKLYKKNKKLEKAA